MHCPACQREITDNSNFCYYCGTRQVPGAVGRKLMRSAVDKTVAGVCAGFADYFGVDPTLLRIVWAFVTLATGILPGTIAYVIAWILMPQAPFLRAPAAAPNAPAHGSGAP
ncbi:MAG TPA: PspC domain-containing protein [Candidatus Acidoferrales bacterium]|nr:PspC domain-containing protein [Candidatus Acidoferrales bacterium]